MMCVILTIFDRKLHEEEKHFICKKSCVSPSNLRLYATARIMTKYDTLQPKLNEL